MWALRSTSTREARAAPLGWCDRHCDNALRTSSAGCTRRSDGEGAQRGMRSPTPGRTPGPLVEQALAAVSPRRPLPPGPPTPAPPFAKESPRGRGALAAGFRSSLRSRALRPGGKRRQTTGSGLAAEPSCGLQRPGGPASWGGGGRMAGGALVWCVTGWDLVAPAGAFHRRVAPRRPSGRRRQRTRPASRGLQRWPGRRACGAPPRPQAPRR